MLIALAQKFSWVIMRFLNCCVFKFEVVGKENIAKIEAGPLIIAANHKSFWDVFFLGSVLGFSSKLWPLRFITADWLFKSIFWRPLTKILGGFPAHKGEGLEISLTFPLKILKEKGGVVVFFPEGRIIKEKDILGEPKRGIGALSLWSEAPIIPVAIKGSRGMRRRKGVKLVYGQPFKIRDKFIPAGAEPTTEDFEKASEIIMEEIKKLYFV